jgi:hypothetical protein
MAPELRNLPHIASMAFNEPLMLEPAYARVFFCALAGQMGITRLTDAASGMTLGAEQIAEPLALFGDDDDITPGHLAKLSGDKWHRCITGFRHTGQQNPVSTALFRHDGLQRNYCSFAAGDE